MLITENRSRLIWILILLLIFNIIIPGTLAGDNPDTNEDSIPIEGTEGDEPESDLFASITQTVQIDPGEMFYIYFDPGDDELSTRPPEDLPPECDQALALAPEWLRDNLSYKFRQLSSEFQTTYANLILNSPDDKYIDEIAFVIAHTAVENLQDDYFFPELITHNAQLIYENDQYLHYVEVVEKGDFTTTIYKDKNNLSYELPRDIYYWYIVHPKLSDELATYVDPNYNFTTDPPFDRNYGVAPPTGKFWRDWLFYSNDSGYPLLKEKLEGAYTVWEAISACNSWISGSMRFTSDTERPIQPVRIYRKHIGRCGEYQDMRNAIARSSLIPSTCTINNAEDHVWNEFWDKRWIHWDGTTDNPMMYENGWGKKISSVWNTRGDSHIWSVTKKYTKICNFTATVLDDSGMPVDGALVRVSTENYYNPDLLTTTTWGTTDYTGTVTIPLGDERNFWASAESDDLGSDPLNGVTQVISNSEAGENYTYTFNLPASAQQLNSNEITPPGVVDPKFRMEIHYEVENFNTRAENVYTGEHGNFFGPSGNVDFFIANSFNYNRYLTDLSFDAYQVRKKSTSDDIIFILPNDDRYYTVFSNEFSQETAKIINITVNIYSSLMVGITSPEEGSEFNQGDSVYITGSAWGPEGIENVQIDVDNQENWIDTADTSGGGEEPYDTWEINLDTMDLKPGIHLIKARAFDDENSSIVQLNISLVDVTDPDLFVEGPIDDEVFWLGEYFFVFGTATDNGWIENLKLIIDSDDINSIDLIPYLNEGIWSYEVYSNDLGYGAHTITIWVNDTASNYASITRNFNILEAVIPEVRIDTPYEGSIFLPGETVNISGFASDNMEILSLELKIDNDTSVNITQNLDSNGFWYYNWETQSTTSEGSHIIEAKIVDGSGNMALDSVTVTLDGTIPELIIENPQEGSEYYEDEFLTVKGTAKDDTGIYKLILIIDSDEVNATDIRSYLNGDIWSYNLYLYDLGYGQHTISVLAEDGLSNYVLLMRNINVLESIEPSVNIDSPTEGLITWPGDTILVSGDATDNTEIITLELIIDSVTTIDITSNLEDDGTWSYYWVTSSGSHDGEYAIEARATDGSGNIAFDSIKVILDGTDPEASITLPEENQVFEAGQPIELQGLASDDWGIDEVHLIIDDEDEIDITWKTSEGNWDHKYWYTSGLSSGSHTISLVVVDNAGNTKKDSITFQIDNQDPVLEISSTEETAVMGEFIKLQGIVSDDLEIKKILLVIDDNEPIDITSSFSNGNWEYRLDTLDLTLGKHTITIIVSDEMGNQVSDDIRIRIVEDINIQDNIPTDSEDGKDESDSSNINLVVLLLIVVIVLVLVTVAIALARTSKKK
jgi:hypothetical protein